MSQYTPKSTTGHDEIVGIVSHNLIHEDRYGLTMPTIILVRHGEVFNPNHVVYADLSGFDLSATGVQQAHATAEHLAPIDIDIVLSSPLTRALHTAAAIALHQARLGVTVDSRLTEARMYPEWTGLTWDEVERLFPRELSDYLTDATCLRDASESVSELFDRMLASVHDAIDDGHRTIAVVAHQDPIQTLRLGLVGRPLSELRLDPPRHASVTTIQQDERGDFVEISTWNPENTDL